MASAPHRVRQRTARLILETLEERLTPAWASVPIAVLPSIPTDTESLVLNDQGDVSEDGGIDDAGEIDWYEVEAVGTGAAIFSVTTPDSDLNTVMAIYKSNKARLQHSDNISATNTDSKFTVNLVKGQTYYLGITNLNGTVEEGSYTLKIDGVGKNKQAPDDRFENNDSLATAVNVGTLLTEKNFANLVMADGEDWFRFTLPTVGSPTSYASIYFDNSQGDLDLELYDAGGSLALTSSGTGDEEELSMAGLAPGNYYVRVYGDSNPSYTMVLTPKLLPGAPGFTIQLRMTGLSIAQQSIFYQAAFRWSAIITSDLQNARFQGINVDDLLIEASAVNIDGVSGVLGQAAPDRFRSNGLPYHGFMEFDKADLTSLQNSGQLLSVILHEMGHVLGIGTIWESLSLIDKPGSDDPRYIGAQATAQYNAIFGTNLTSIPVENEGGSGTADSHWRESVLKNELMTGFLDSGRNPLSRITVGSLADLGYTVNFAKADPYTKPLGSLMAGSGSTGTAGGAALRLSDLDWSGTLTEKQLNVRLGSSVVSASTTTPSNQSMKPPLPTDSVFATLAMSQPSKRAVQSLIGKVSIKL